MAEDISGLMFAVIGLGRSGLHVGKASLALGAKATIFDSSEADAMAKPELIAEAMQAGIEVVTGWNGHLPPGYSTIVVNPAIDPRTELFGQLVAYGKPIWSEIEFAYRIAKAPIVAVTGTNGKSTTAVLTYLALEACHAGPILCGNVFGTGYPEKTLTEAALTASSEQVLVAEISSFQLEGITTFKPVAAAITNISPDHQDRYSRYEDYVAAKQKLFAFQGADNYAVVPSAGWGVTPPRNSKVLKFGWGEGEARVVGKSLDILRKSVRLDTLPFGGQQHNVLNAMTAGLLSAGYLAWRGAPLECRMQFFEGFRKFRGLAHRMEVVGERGGVTVINNSMCTNPDAVLASAKSVPGRVHLLIGGVNKGLKFGLVARYLKDNELNAYIFGRDRDDIAAQLGPFPTFKTMQEAFAAAVAAAKPGETILLAPGCASTDQFRDFRDRGDVFRGIAAAWVGAVS